MASERRKPGVTATAATLKAQRGHIECQPDHGHFGDIVVKRRYPIAVGDLDNQSFCAPPLARIRP
jgi:hypothetical protein